MLTIMVVEDDTNTRKLMKAVLKNKGYNVLEASDGEEAFDIIDREYVDLILLDIMMPKMDGISFAKNLRSVKSQIPILMVTARGEHEYIKKGFLSGIDDYMIKPVDEEEMLLRINALLRRAKIARDKKIIINDAVLDYASLTVSDDKNSILLPPKEFYLLFKLLAYPGQIFTKNQLMDEIWGKESYTDPITVNVHINRLRKKFAGWKQFEIITIRGLGYKGIKHEKKK
ncbi:MAG: response regulator transcription factor [Pleomorphochaeta sp.]